MNRSKKCSLLATALASWLALWPALAPADSLVTTDGDSYYGPVTKTATGYTIQTEDGPVDIAAEKVKRILYDHPPAAAATSAQPAAAPTHTASAKKQIDPRTMNALIEQGETAIASAQFGDARDAFKDVLTIDPKNAVAGRGLGFAYIALGKPTKAVDSLEIAALNPPLDRSLVLALSSALVANHNSMRAAKFLMPWLQAHAQPVDETMLNALGISLSQADSSAGKSALFKDAVKLYLKLNSDLEATMPGKRRWGTEWMDAGDVAAKEAARASAQTAVNDAWNKLQSTNSDLTSAQNELSRVSAINDRRNDGNIRSAQQKVDQANQNQSKAQSAYDTARKALADLPPPTFPTLIVVDNADLVMPDGATVAAAGASAQTPKADQPTVASAAPAVPDAKPATPTPSQKAQPETAQTPDPVPQTAAAEPAKPHAPKHVTRYAAAFAIAPDILVTSSATVADATTITIETSDGKSATATVLRTHQSDGLALLKVEGAKYPCLSLASSMTDGAVSCLGFPEVDLFNPIPENMDVTAGAATDSWTVRFTNSPRLPGGPLLQNGAVVGVELGDRDSDLAAVPAATLKALTSLIDDSGNQSTLTTDPKQAVMQVMAER